MFSVSPRVLLALFTVMMLVVYFDRGAVGSAVKALEDAFDISETRAGLVASLFMISFTLSSPIFAHFSSYSPPLKMVAVGMGVWIIAVLGTAFSPVYAVLALVRCLSGIGEASFLCISPTIINLVAPKERKSVWLSIFYSSIPIGYALGFIASGSVIGNDLFGQTWSWRSVFIFEGVIMIPFIFYVFRMSGPKSMKELDTEGTIIHASGLSEFLQNFFSLLRNRIWVVSSLGYAAQTFLLGGFSFFGIKYGTDYLNLGESTSSYLFGGVTVFSGIVGTAFGGVVLDALKKKYGMQNINAIACALGSICVYTIISIPFCFGGFFVNSSAGFFILLGFAEFFMFSCISPINAVILLSVPLEKQPFATAGSIICIHALGDAISPSVIGAILDASGENWTLAMTLTSCMLFICLGLWLVGFRWALNDMRLQKIEEETQPLITPN